MRKVVAKLVIAMAIAAVAVLGADNSIGTWSWNVAKSKSEPPSKNPIKSLTEVYEPEEGGVKVTATGERQDGTKMGTTYSFKYDGREYPVTGGAWDRIAVKQIDANTFVWEHKKAGGKYHTTGRTVISSDGKTMTNTSEGTNSEGKPTSAFVVYEKQ